MRYIRIQDTMHLCDRLGNTPGPGSIRIEHKAKHSLVMN